MRQVRRATDIRSNVGTVFLGLLLVAGSASPAAAGTDSEGSGGVESSSEGQTISTLAWNEGGFVKRPDPCEGRWDTVSDGAVVRVKKPVEGSDPDEANPDYEEKTNVLDKDKFENSEETPNGELPTDEKPVVQGDNTKPIATPDDEDDTFDFDAIENGRLQDGSDGLFSLTSETEDKSDGNGGFWTVHTGFECGDNKETWTAITPTSSQQLIPSMVEEATRRLHKPELTIKPFDTENDWTYVQVPIDFRTTNESAETVTFTADTGGPEETRKWITVEAKPDELTYESGDKNAKIKKKTCPANQGTETGAPYDPENPGECSYTYTNASSTAPNGKTFEATLSLTWNVTYTSSDGPGTIKVAPTTQTQTIQIAEIKAVNTP